MSHAERLHAHAEQMRMRAALLKLGDDEAQHHAHDLEVEADEIDHLTNLRPVDAGEDDYQ